MKYYLGQARLPIQLEQQDVIGSGGEAVIYHNHGKAVKIYRDPNRDRSRKLEFFFNAGYSFPSNIIAPEEPVFDKSSGGNLVGFQMKLLPAGCKPLAMLMRSDFCDQAGVTTLMKINIFISLLKGLEAINRQGNVVVGDLNDQNEIFADLATGEVYWIDVDSWQIGGFPCMVGTEDYLSPDLYNADLSKKPMFKPEHDYYSFAVLMFRTLLLAHPFGSGTHKQFLSLFDRARNGLSILDPSVRYPKRARPKELLTDDLLSLLEGYLKRQRRDIFPVAELEAYAEQLTECQNCHLWYPASRDHCPGCAAKTIASAKAKARVSGCVCDILLETPGRIIWHQLADTTLCVLAEEDGMTVLYRKQPDKQAIRQELFKTLPDAAYALFGDTLAVCTDPTKDQPEILLININVNPIKGIGRTTTNSYSGGRAVFGSSGKRLYRLAGSSLMSCDMYGEHLADRQVMEVIPNQTIFFIAANPEVTKDREAAIIAQRVFSDLFWSLAVSNDGGRSYGHYPIGLDPLTAQESLIDASVRFGVKFALVLRHTRLRGTNYVRIERVDLSTGNIVDAQRVKATDQPLYGDVHGKAFADSAVLHATDSGITMQNLPDFTETILPGTDAYINGGEQLLRYGNGIMAITTDRIILLKPEPKR